MPCKHRQSDPVREHKKDMAGSMEKVVKFQMLNRLV